MIIWLWETYERKVSQRHIVVITKLCVFPHYDCLIQMKATVDTFKLGDTISFWQTTFGCNTGNRCSFSAVVASKQKQHVSILKSCLNLISTIKNYVARVFSHHKQIAPECISKRAETHYSSDLSPVVCSAPGLDWQLSYQPKRSTLVGKCTGVHCNWTRQVRYESSLSEQFVSTVSTEEE